MSEKNVVYSTDPGWKQKCPKCGEPVDDCICKADNISGNTGQKIYIERDRKHRKGKTVTVISGLKGDLKKIQKELQKLCGAGGSVKSGNVEIQGDQTKKIQDYLEKQGYRVIRRGG